MVVGLTKGFLRGKALSVEGHVHDDRYYTENEMNTLLSGKSPTNHTHDDRYFTESEMNTKLNAKFNYNGTTQNNVDMNTLTTQGTHIALYASGINQTNLHTPWGDTISGYSSVTHYNLMTLYCNNRITQIAYSVYRHNQGMWYRMKHDANWSKWYKVSIEETSGSENLVSKIVSGTYNGNVSNSIGTQTITVPGINKINFIIVSTLSDPPTYVSANGSSFGTISTNTFTLFNFASNNISNNESLAILSNNTFRVGRQYNNSSSRNILNESGYTYMYFAFGI